MRNQVRYYQPIKHQCNRTRASFLGGLGLHPISRYLRASSKMPLPATFLLLASLVFFSFPAHAEITNSTCPVLAGEMVDQNIFTDYQGKRVYFCCNKCRRDFLADPEKYLAGLPQFASVVSTGETAGKTAAETTVTEESVPTPLKTSPVAIIGKFHPLVVHFPIALTFTALLFTLFSMIKRNPRYELIGVRIIYLAAAFSVLSALLGLAAGSGTAYPAILRAYFHWHRIFGISSAIMTPVVAFLAFQFQRRETVSRLWRYRIALFVLSLIIGVTGHLGATLVYGPNYFSS